MYTKEEINKIFEKIASAIDISEAMFDKAEKTYNELGTWLDKQTPNYRINIYAQGSFALGTVVRPLSDKDEDYDLDLVCEFAEQYDLAAKQLKVDVIKPLLERYSKIGTIEEKRRCWQVTYENYHSFHMDIIPAFNYTRFIYLTDKDEDYGIYDYIGSNPKRYIAWFNDRKKVRYNSIVSVRKNAILRFQASQEDLKEFRLKTPLQKAIQILKRHRNNMFKDDPNHLAPVSIIITTIAAHLYNNEDNIYDALTNILKDAKSFVALNKRNGNYHIDNPTYTGLEVENFADKWNEHTERAEAFFDWVDNAKQNLIDSFTSMESEADLVNIVASSIGDSIARRSFPDTTKAEKIITEKTQGENTALVPQKVKSLLAVPHRVQAPWILPRGSRVVISAYTRDIYGNKVKYQNDGPPLPKGVSIEFRAMFGGISQPYTVRWQVVNTGYEAQQAGCMRGRFETSDLSKHTRQESTQYQGSHYVQCFVTRGSNQCLAKSDIFIVNIQ